jgi:hypothetical protein
MALAISLEFVVVPNLEKFIRYLRYRESKGTVPGITSDFQKRSIDSWMIRILQKILNITTLFFK